MIRKLLFLNVIFFSNPFQINSQTITATLTATSTVVPPDFFGFNASNVIRSDKPYINDSNLVNKFSQVYSGNTRWPGGQIANWWDWRTGAFKSYIPPNIQIRGDLEGLGYKENTLSKYKVFNDRNALNPVYDFNLMTSNKYYEAAQIYAANGLNLPMKNIELGNEFYLDEDEYLTTFPTPESYTSVSNDWATFFKSLPGGSNLKIAVVGAADRFPLDPAYSRQNIWTNRICNSIGNNINAVTMHLYTATNLNTKTISLSNLRQAMEGPFTAWDGLKPQLDFIRTYGKEVWITEFNLFDNAHCIHGTWAAGLYTAAMALTYNEDTIIKISTIHNMIGDAIFSMIYSDTAGFDFGDFYIGGLGCNVGAPKTDPLEFTAQGNAMSLVGKALINANTRKRISFTNAPMLPVSGTHEALYGWWFDSNVSSNAVIMNMDSLDHNITIDQNSWNVSGGTYTQMYPGPGGPLALIKGNAVTTPGIYEVATTGNMSVAQTILLKAYSITLIEKKKNAVSLKVVDNTICSGSSTALSVTGGTSYTWTGQNLTNIVANGSVKQFTATVANTTVYTFTVTDVGGASASATITVYPKPVLTTSSNQQTVCKGYPVKLSAELTGGNASNFTSMIWIQDNGKEISNCMDPIVNVNPDKSTTYFVYATDGFCWANLDSQKVNINAIADAGSDQFVCTDSLPKTISAKNILQGYNYKWYQNNTLISNSATASVSPVAKTTYTLIVINASDASCTDTALVTLDPIICCTSSDSSALTFGTYITIKDFATKMKAYCLATGQGTATDNSLSDFHKEIVINGTLAVDRIFTFTNCDKIKFGERSEIKFTSNAKPLFLKKCKLMAAPCSGKMWSGLRANLYACTITIDSSYISGAEVAVLAQDDAYLYANYSKFENNYQGIYVYDYHDVFKGTIKGDSFVYTALLPPHAGERPLCGVRFEDVLAGNIGDSSYSEPPNYFSNLDYGIYGYGGGFNAYNNIFTNFYPDDTIHENEGSAIYAFNPNGSGNIADTSQLWPRYELLIGNLAGGKQSNTFTNCKFGINTDNVELKARGNKLTNTDRAIRNVNGTLSTLDASKNVIRKSNAAIEFITPKASVITINNDSITTDTAYNSSTVKAAIRITDDPFNMSVITIDENVIYTYGTHGIYVSTSDYGKYTDNKVFAKNSNTNFPVIDFRFEDCDSIDFSCNLASGSTINQITNKTGMQFINSNLMRVRCNNIDKVDLGMEFLGDCDNMQLRNNEYYYSNIGFSVGAFGIASGVIGPQPIFGAATKPYGNKFYGTATSNSTLHGVFGVAATRSVNSNLAGGVNDAGRFYVYQDSIQVPTPNILVGTGSAITPYYSNKIPNLCGAGCSHPNPLRPKRNLKVNKIAAINIDSVDDGEMSEISFNISDILEADMNDPITYSRMKGLFKLTDSQNSNFGSEDVLLLNRKIAETNIDQFNKVLSLISLLGSNQKVIDRKKILELAKKLNSNISPKNLMEKNEKHLNAIVFDRLLYSKNFTSTQIQNLQYIANQCPYLGGDAVFKARSLCSAFDNNIYYNDLKLCAETKQQLLASRNKQSPMVVNVYPLPASDVLNFDYDLSAYKEAELLLMDVTGRVFKTIKLNKFTNHTTINVSDLAPGFYEFQITDNRQKITGGKICLMR